MRSPGFGPLRWNPPQPDVKSELVPQGIRNFAFPLSRQDEDSKRGDRDWIGPTTVSVVQRSPQFGNLVEPEYDGALSGAGIEVGSPESLDAR